MPILQVVRSKEHWILYSFSPCLQVHNNTTILILYFLANNNVGLTCHLQDAPHPCLNLPDEDLLDEFLRTSTRLQEM